MPIMTLESIVIPGRMYYQYVPPDRVDLYTGDGWRINVPEPVHPTMQAYYETCREDDAPHTDDLADWERELLDPSDPSASPVPIPPGSVPTPVTVEPEAETGEDEPDEDTFMCEWCQGEYHMDEQLVVGSFRYITEVCSECYDGARECDECGRPIDIHSDEYVCFGEYDLTYFCGRCDHCSAWCDDCQEYYDARNYSTCPRGCYESSGLHNYSHKPMPEFYIVDRDGKPTIVRAHTLHTTRRELVSVPFMGFELEMERNGCGTRIDTIVGRVYDMWGDFAYCKHDGSLNDGLELVTHPFTLEYAHEHINWDLLDSIRRDGYRSWNTTTAGMHVHVNRATFTGPAHLFRFAQLIYKNEPTCSSFAGRSNNAYATFHDGYQKGYLANVVKGRAHGSRGAVNMQNADTIEVRIFRGSLRYQRVLANLEFVHACVEYTRQLTVPDVVRGGLSWRTFATWILDNRSTYPHLFEYLDLNPTNPNHTNEPALATY